MKTYKNESGVWNCVYNEITRESSSELLLNDLELISSGFQFNQGDLDWYLEDNTISEKHKREIRTRKKELNI